MTVWDISTGMFCLSLFPTIFFVFQVLRIPVTEWGEMSLSLLLPRLTDRPLKVCATISEKYLPSHGFLRERIIIVLPVSVFLCFHQMPTLWMMLLEKLIWLYIRQNVKVKTDLSFSPQQMTVPAQSDWIWRRICAMQP